MESVFTASFIYTDRNFCLAFSEQFLSRQHRLLSQRECHSRWFESLRVKVKGSKFNWFPSSEERKKEDGALWKIPGVCTHVICQCANQQGFHLLTDIHACFLSPMHCWCLALNLTHCWTLKGIRCTLSFLFLLASHWCCCSSAVSGQTIRACLCILQFPAFQSHSHDPTKGIH